MVASVYAHTSMHAQLHTQVTGIAGVLNAQYLDYNGLSNPRDGLMVYPTFPIHIFVCTGHTRAATCVCKDFSRHMACAYRTHL